MILNQSNPSPATLLDLCQAAVESYGFLLVETKIGQQGKFKTLEVTIFHPQRSCGLEDCESVSRMLDSALEAHNPPPIDGPFLLEVLSPGIDRYLKMRRDFEIFAGQTVEVKTKEKMINLGSAFICRLVGLDHNIITIDQLAPLPAAPGKSRGKVKTASSSKLASLPRQCTIDLDQIISVRLASATPIFTTSMEEAS